MNAINLLCVAVAMLAIVCLMLLRIVGRLELRLNMINERSSEIEEYQSIEDEVYFQLRKRIEELEHKWEVAS